MPTLILEHGPHGTAGVVGQTLRANGLRTTILDLARGDSLPNDLDDVDAIVSCSGDYSACDTSIAWMDGERAILKAAYDSSKPLLGFGLGGHLLAQALGGRVEPLETARCGLADIKLTPVGRDDPLFRGLPWYGVWSAWEFDSVIELPPNSTLLASGETPNQAWCSGVWTYGFQFNPHWDSDTLLQRCDDPATRATVMQNAEAAERQTARFADNISSYLLPTASLAVGK